MVIRTKPAQERWASENAVRQGFTTYLPKVGQHRRHPPRPALFVSAPLFPCYLFIRLEPEHEHAPHWRRLLGTFGVIGVVRVGERPASVHQSVISALQSREDAAGLIELPPRFPLRSKVTITKGGFAGQQGLYAGMAAQDRQRVLLDFLGRSIQVLIPIQDLQSAA